MNTNKNTLVIFDPAPWSGHSVTYTTRLVAAFQERAYRVTLIAPSDFKTTAVEHIALKRSWRGVELRLVRKAASDRDALIVDLDYSRTLRSVLVGGRFPRNSVHVLHSVGLVRRIGAQEFHRRRSLIRTQLFLHLMRRHDAQGCRIVVHTPEAYRYLSSQGVSSVLAPLPSLIADPQRLNQTVNVPRTHVLFVGGTRIQKGFAMGLTAVRAVEAYRSMPVVVTGASDAECDAVDLSGVVFEGRVSSERLELLYATAALVMLPYPEQYALTGAASLVLQEALHAGCKVVATPWAKEQATSQNLFVPNDYSLSALIEAIRSAQYVTVTHRYEPDTDAYLAVLARDD